MSSSKLHSRIAPHRYALLLACEVSLTVIGPLLESVSIHRLFLDLLIILVLVASSLSVTVRRSGRLWLSGLAVICGFMWVTSSILSFPPFDTVAFRLVTEAVCLAFFAAVSGIILVDILTSEVTTNCICGAMCVYLLIGFCFAIVHSMIVSGDPGAYTNALPVLQAASQDRHSWLPRRCFDPFVYFSFVTFSGVGYGDVLPVSRLARSVSWLETVVGQFYMTVLVARLVGLHISNEGKKANSAEGQ